VSHLGQPRPRSDQFDPAGQSPDLVLPAPAGRNHLLQTEDLIEELRFLNRRAQQRRESLQHRTGQDTARAQPRSPRDRSPRGQAQPASKGGQEVAQRRVRVCRARDYTAEDECRLEQRKRIRRVGIVENVADGTWADRGLDIARLEQDGWLGKHLGLSEDGQRSTQPDGSVQHGAAAFEGVGRGIRPATPQVDPCSGAEGGTLSYL